NHCIVAVKLSNETQAGAVLQHPTLGRLLIFDATDDTTAVGDLPIEEQGSLALIVAGEAGTLERMPILPPESRRLDREALVTLAATGSITASVKEHSIGQAAVLERREYRGLSSGDYRKMIEDWITRGATAAKVSKVDAVDESNEGKFALDVEFTVEAYG